MDHIHQVQSEIQFAIQFKKDTSGNTLSLAAAKKLQSSASESMLSLLEEGKQLKALTPKVEK